MYEIRHYLAPNDGRDLYIDWLEKLRDTTARIAVVRRVTRIELGNFGDHKFCRDGVWELRIDVVQVIGCITPSQGKRSYYCCVAGTNRRRVRTLTVLANFGRIGKRSIYHEK